MWIAPDLGLPELPFVDFGDVLLRERPDGVHWKTRPLVDYAGGRPFARVDDEQSELDQTYVTARHQGPGLLHHVNPRIGLRENDFHTLADFASSLNTSRTTAPRRLFRSLRTRSRDLSGTAHSGVGVGVGAGVRFDALASGGAHDVTRLIPLPHKVQPVAGTVGRPRRGPDMLFADRATTTARTGDCCGNAASRPGSRNAISPTAAAWASFAGSGAAERSQRQ